jgi:hypothetical protein
MDLRLRTTVAIVGLRYREDNLIAYCLYKFKNAGWEYDEFVPRPRYVTDSSVLQIGTTVFNHVKKDQFFKSAFYSDSASGLPSGMNEVVIRRRKKRIGRGCLTAYSQLTQMERTN